MTTVPLRNNRRPFRISALWLCSRCCHQCSTYISGIITDDAARTIEIQLDHPEGDILYILALEFAHFFPAGTPASDQSTHPIPSTGPYMLQSYTPNRSFTLVRNPN